MTIMACYSSMIVQGCKSHVEGLLCRMSSATRRLRPIMYMYVYIRCTCTCTCTWEGRVFVLGNDLVVTGMLSVCTPSDAASSVGAQ